MAERDDLMRLTRRLHLVSRGPTSTSRWRPAADIYRTDEGWMIKFELAGVPEGEFDLSVSGRHLVLRGHRYDKEVVEGAFFHSLEIAYSAFERHIELPESVDQARFLTEYRHGMLLVRIITEASGS